LIRWQIFSKYPSVCGTLTKYEYKFSIVVLNVDELRLCLWTAAANGPIAHPPDMRMPQWNDIGRWKPKNSEKNLSHCHMHHTLHMESELGAFWGTRRRIRTRERKGRRKKLLKFLRVSSRSFWWCIVLRLQSKMLELMNSASAEEDGNERIETILLWRLIQVMMHALGRI
jgi:hypothetical protein